MMSSHGSRHVDHCPFARGIEKVGSASFQPSHAAHVDDGAFDLARVLFHRRHGMLRHRDHTTDGDLQPFCPLLQIDVDCGSWSPGNADVVHQNVQAIESIQRQSDRYLSVPGQRHIAIGRNCKPTVRHRIHHVCSFRRPGYVAIQANNIATFIG